MKKGTKKNLENYIPSTNELEKEIHRVKYKSRYNSLLKSSLRILLIVLAIATIVATLIFPVLQMSDSTMDPILKNGDIILTIKEKKVERGDVIAFYYNNHILVKRVIALSGEWVEIDKEGNVYINGQILNEPYVTDKDKGEYDIEFPYQVPENTYFVLNDLRSESIDSRNSLLGTVSIEDTVGKVIFRLWPIKRLGII